MFSTRSRALQYVVIITALALVAGGGWWFYLRSQAGVQLGTGFLSGTGTGLVGYWTFDSADISGTTAIDRSGQGNDGTIGGSPSVIAHSPGSALRFNGTSQYVNVPADTSLNPTTGVTVSVWLRSLNPGGAFPYIVARPYNSDHAAYALLVDTSQTPDTLAFDIGWGATNGNHTFSPGERIENVFDGSWHHVVGTYDKSFVRLYIDGEEIGAGTAETRNIYYGGTTLPVGIGRYDSSLGLYYGGDVDDARIYDHALSATEVSDLFGSTRGRVETNGALNTDPLTQSLVGYWALDNGSGATATDASGNGNNGTLTNGPTWNTGQIGGAVAFDGSNDSIEIPDSEVLDQLYSYSLSAWIYPTALPASGGYKDIITKTDGAGVDSYWLELNRPAGISGIEFGHPGGVTYCSYDPPLSAWTHVTGVYDDAADNIRIYVNGEQLCVTPGIVNNSTDTATPVRIGAGWTGENFTGRIDEARIYARALPIEEVRELYATTQPSAVPDTSLVARWTFDGPLAAGGVAYDISRRGTTLGYNPANVTKSTGKIGQGMRIKGAPWDFFGGGDDATLNPGTGDMTFAGWMRLETLNNWAGFVTKYDGSVGYQTYIDSIGRPVAFIDSGPSQFYYNGNSPFELEGSGWHHLGFVIDRDAGVFFYVDGDLVTQDGTSVYNGTNITNTSGVNVGGNDGNVSTMSLDDVRAYNRALSAAEMRALYDAGAQGAEINSAPGDSLAQGLAGYWPLENGSGASASDVSGNGNNLTLTNMESGDWVTGRIGSYGLDFDGTNEYATVADPASGVLDFDLVGTGSGSDMFTITGWFNRRSATTDDTIVAKKNDQTTDIGYVVWLDDASDNLNVDVYGSNASGSTVGSGTTFTTTGWHHFAAVIGQPLGSYTYEDFPKLYIDGERDGLASSNGYQGYVWDVSNARAFRIGAESDGGNPFDGQLDDIRIYNRALQPEEINKLYRVTSPPSIDTSLVGHWTFDGPDVRGTTAFDRSGRGNDGALTGGPTRAAGKIGQGLSFPGVNSALVEVGSSATWSNLSQSTRCAWVNLNSLTNADSDADQRIIANNVIRLQVYTSGVVRMEVFTDGVHPITDSTISLTPRIWYHVCGVHNGIGTAPTIYIDGVDRSSPVSAGTGTMWDESAETLGIGGTTNNPTYGNLSGKLDDVRLYNRVLSGDEVRRLYEMGI